MPCELCEAISDRFRLILEDELSFAIIIREPQVDLHSLVLPKRHVTSFSDLTEQESLSLHRMVSLLQGKIESALDKPCTIMANSPRYATQPHIHYQLVPAKAGIRTLVSAAEGVPERKEATIEDLKRMARRLRTA